MMIPSILLGLGLGVLFLWLARHGPVEERLVWAVGLIVAAVIYVEFAAVGGASASWLWAEVGGIAVYGSLATLGLRGSSRWIAVGWLLHPLWDLGLHFWQAGAEFTPGWYALACLSFDLIVGVYIWSQELLAG